MTTVLFNAMTGTNKLPIPFTLFGMRCTIGAFDDKSSSVEIYQQLAQGMVDEQRPWDKF